ncbi:MAG: NYN domain-containing protein [Endomicrobiaceae bacterium]|nr:NYN domain-containing protein [Endomicrobiaceae bacterium]
MEYIIDGYNVIKNDKYSHLFEDKTLEKSRNKLFNFVYSNHPQGENNITIVFDCRNKNPYEFDGYSAGTVIGMRIIFSDGQLRADDVIVELVENAENPADMTIVTNDKGIKRRIGGSGAKTKSVEDFIIKGLKNIKKTDNISKMAEKDNVEQINKEFLKKWLNKK